MTQLRCYGIIAKAVVVQQAHQDQVVVQAHRVQAEHPEQQAHQVQAEHLVARVHLVKLALAELAEHQEVEHRLMELQ